MADLSAARLNMVESQVRTSDVTDVRVHDAMRAIAREDFLPPSRAYLAYADMAVEGAEGRPLLSPRDVARAVQALRPEAGERALAVAAPYAAAMLSRMGVNVERFDGADLAAVPAGPFDFAVCEGAVARTPQAWIDALAPGGRLLAVERDGQVARAVLIVRGEEGVTRRPVFDSSATLLAGFEPKAGFVFPDA